MMNKGDVVQFNEKHKWCGCLGFITEIKTIHKKDENEVEVKVEILSKWIKKTYLSQ